MAGRRSSFYFPKDAVAELESILSRSRFSSGTDVIRLAVNTYSRLLEFIDSGCQLLVVSKTGEAYPYSPYRRFQYPGLPNFSKDRDNVCCAAKTFFFTGEFIDTLSEITKRGHVRTNSEAIRLALVVYRELNAVVDVGDEVVVCQTDGKAFSFDPDAPRAPLVPSRNLRPARTMVAQLG